MAMKILIVVFWVVRSYSLVGESQRFGGIYRPCFQVLRWRQCMSSSSTTLHDMFIEITEDS
jgi:hypothetical protein